MLLKTLLLSCFVLVNLTGTRCHKHVGGNSAHPKETTRKTPKIVFSSPSQCARQCKNGEPPKTCYYRFNLELYPVLGEACKHCTPNSTNTIKSNCQCVTANGVERIMLAVNRMLPGPSIQVCLGDKIVVDVINNMEGMETSIHWHGLHQRGSQYYDGVPFITQCPIPQGNTFRYQFIAANEGTHLWYSESGLQSLDGVHGSLIVRAPPCNDPNSSSYNYDLPEHVVVLSDWFLNQATERFPGTLNINRGQHPDSLLINGLGQYKDKHSGKVTTSPSAVFRVKQGHKYRFRLINAGFTVCPIEFTIEGHSMILIAADGVPVQPRTVTTIVSSPGDRFDIVVNANQHPSSYWIQVRALGKCSVEKTQQTAILRYEGTTCAPKSKQPTYDEGLPQKVVLNPLNAKCTLNRTNALHISDLESARPVDKRILRKPDRRFYISANFLAYPPKALYKPGTYNPYLVAPNNRHVVATMGNVSFKFPSSPPLSQSNNLLRKTFCNADHPPRSCRIACACTSVYEIPLGSLVELIIVDERALPGLQIPFHMHGYSFNLMGMGNLPDLNMTKISAKKIRQLDSKHSIPRNFNLPPFKDTFFVPTNGYVILRFLADNPGYWFLRGQIPFHRAIGMGVVFHVGKSSDLPPVPRNFPVCGNYIPLITPIKH